MSLQAAVPPVVLASASAARAAVLRDAGIVFEAVPAAVDEAAVKGAARAEGAAAGDAAMLLAGLKAQAVGRRRPEALVIGCDQILVCGGAWFDKPVDLAAARAQLLALRGAEHGLETAVVCHRNGAEIWRHLARPRLVMRAFSEAFLDAYLLAEGEALLGSVGAYRLEGRGALLFERIEGEHQAIMGLPLLPLLGFLRQHRVLMS
jgi:septum formation protein